MRYSTRSAVPGRCHIFQVLSSEAVTRMGLVGCSTTLATDMRWPCQVGRTFRMPKFTQMLDQAYRATPMHSRVKIRLMSAEEVADQQPDRHTFHSNLALNLGASVSACSLPCSMPHHCPRARSYDCLEALLQQEHQAIPKGSSTPTCVSQLIMAPALLTSKRPPSCLGTATTNLRRLHP